MDWISEWAEVESPRSKKFKTMPFVVIPKDEVRPGENKHERAYRACSWLWSYGLYPTPTYLSMRLYGHESDNVNGAVSKARRKFLADRGIPLMKPNGRRIREYTS